MLTRSLGCRKFSFPARRRYSPQSTNIVFSDPHRADLFYHFFNPPTPLARTLPAFALSFLHQPPPSADSAVVIGWLPALRDSEQETRSTLQDFRANPKFISFLHEVVHSGLTEQVDDIWKDAALQLQNGWMHIHDQRNPPNQGRIGDPDDIIGSVLVEKSKIRAETYQPMPSYRVCTSDGVLQLTPGLSDYLKCALLRRIETTEPKS